MQPLRFIKLWLALGWLAVGAVIYLSLTSNPINISIANGDKLGHFLAYGVMMGWFVQLYQSRWMLTLHALFFVVTGVTLEYLQSYYGRYFEYADMAANTGGVLLGLLMLLTPMRTLLLRLEGRFLIRS